MGSFARAELERLLATDTRDTRLLGQLSKLAEEEGDLETAARYQKMHEELAASEEGEARLASLLAKAGEIEEAQAVWSKAAAGKSQSFRVFHAMDNLLTNGKPLPVLEITEASLRTDPNDWEALYRQGLALEQLGRAREAEARFAKLIELAVRDDEPSALGRAQARNPRFQAAGKPNASAHRRGNPQHDAAGGPRRHFLCDPPLLQAAADAYDAGLLMVAGGFRAGPDGGAWLADEPGGTRAAEPAGRRARSISRRRDEDSE